MVLRSRALAGRAEAGQARPVERVHRDAEVPQLERRGPGDVLHELLVPDLPDVLVVDPDREPGGVRRGYRDHAARRAAQRLVTDGPGAGRAARQPEQHQRVAVWLRSVAVGVTALHQGSGPAAQTLAVDGHRRVVAVVEQVAGGGRLDEA